MTYLHTTQTNVIVDIGSTVIKVAEVLADRTIRQQYFIERESSQSIYCQLENILAERCLLGHGQRVLICSSANGGLRVGIVCLTSYYSGTVLRNQALLAGANPVFVYPYEDLRVDTRYVDVLLVGGGIDCKEPGPIDDLLPNLRVDDFRFGSLVFAGNRYLSDRILKLAPEAKIVENPMSSTLSGERSSVFEILRNAYLDDIVHKEDIFELRTKFGCNIRPTPEVVNRGFQMIVSNRSATAVSGAAILIDIGGATTDLHYTTEIVPNDSMNRPPFGASVGRYVFADLGIVASQDSTMTRLRAHPRCYELLCNVLDRDVDENYRRLREGDWGATSQIMAYACLFLALDRFASGDGPGLPRANLNKVSRFLFTGGAVQALSEATIAGIIGLISNGPVTASAVRIDRQYRVWVDGMTASLPKAER